MTACWGRCKGPRTVRIGQEWIPREGFQVATPVLVLHDVDRCPEGAAVAAVNCKRVFERSA